MRGIKHTVGVTASSVIVIRRDNGKHVSTSLINEARRPIEIRIPDPIVDVVMDLLDAVLFVLRCLGWVGISPIIPALFFYWTVQGANIPGWIADQSYKIRLLWYFYTGRTI